MLPDQSEDGGTDEGELGRVTVILKGVTDSHESRQ